MSPDNKTIVLPVRRSYRADGSDDNFGTEFELHNVVSGNAVGSLGFIKAVGVASPDFSVAAACNPGELEFYRLGAGGTLHPSASAKVKDCDSSGGLSQFGPAGLFLALNPIGDGTRLDYQKVQIWDSRSVKLATTLTSTDKITHLSFSSDSKMLLASAEDGTVQVWAIPSGQLVRTFDAQHSLSWADFVPGQASVCALTDEGRVLVWDLNAGQKRISFDIDPEHDGQRVGLLSPDGRLLIAAGTGSEEVLAYDLRSGARLATLKTDYPSVSRVLGLTISQDGTMGVTTRSARVGNYIVRIWRIERE
jgi:WD40 repeat protein